MLTNYHMHSTFSDGKNTPEEIVLTALEKGFVAIGFSDHACAVYDSECCIKDTEGYIAEIKRLKEKYKKDIEIYLGIEEDVFSSVDEKQFDYLIGSMHYMPVGGVYHALDASRARQQACIDALYGDTLRFAETYFRTFCDYIMMRKPDIVGHFDLITKFDEKEAPLFLEDNRYRRIAQNYISEVADCDCLFEVNTGAIGRGYRTTPYPDAELLHILMVKDAKIILSSDSHSAETIDQSFPEMRKYLRDIGFRHAWCLLHGEFKKYDL